MRHIYLLTYLIGISVEAAGACVGCRRCRLFHCADIYAQETWQRDIRNEWRHGEARLLPVRCINLSCRTVWRVFITLYWATL